MKRTRNLLRVLLNQARLAHALPNAWGWRKDSALLMDSSFCQIPMPPGDGVEKALTYSIFFLYIFYSYYPLVPGRDLASVLISRP